MMSRTMHGKPLIYLDSAATTHKPQQVIDALTCFYKEQYATVLRTVYELATNADALYQGVRETIRRFINAASSDEIVYTQNTTDAINLAAYSLGKLLIKPGDVILLSTMEHHSNLVPWQIMCEDRGGVIQIIPVTANGEIDLEAYKKLLEDCRPKIVAVTHVSNVLGTVNPIHEMARLAHEAGALIVVDGAQAIAHLAVDVRALDVDFYAFSGHKLYGPTGIGILYGKKKMLDLMPPMKGGGAMVERVTFAKTTYNITPWKFEAGTMMLAEVIGLGAAVKFVESIGMQNIQAWEQNLLKYACERLSCIEGVAIYGRPAWRESVISFNVKGIHPLDLGTFLDLHGVAIRTGHHCCQPLLSSMGLNATARISIGLYNNKHDIDLFIDALEQVIAKL